MTTITVVGANKAYGPTPVLRDVDLHIPSGSITAILGPSGSGKTTLLRSIAGFERLDQGTITLGPIHVEGPTSWIHPQHRGIGYVPQHGALFPHLRVHANIGFGLPRGHRHRVTELIDLLDLGSLEHRFPHQLSGGQQQRVALARALAPLPSVVLLDEPFSSLDAALRSALRSDVARILRSLGTTTLVVTHDRDEALSMADQIALLHHGRIHAIGHPYELYTTPHDEVTAHVLGAANLLTTTVIDGQLHCPIPIPTTTHTLTDGTYTLLLRPEHLAMHHQPHDHAVPATTLTVDYLGATSHVQLRLHDTQTPPLHVTTPGHHHLTPGQEIWVSSTHPGIPWTYPLPQTHDA